MKIADRKDLIRLMVVGAVTGVLVMAVVDGVVVFQIHNFSIEHFFWDYIWIPFLFLVCALLLGVLIAATIWIVVKKTGCLECIGLVDRQAPQTVIVIPMQNQGLGTGNTNNPGPVTGADRIYDVQPPASVEEPSIKQHNQAV